jgi:hypothetical protein
MQKVSKGFVKLMYYYTYAKAYFDFKYKNMIFYINTIKLTTKIKKMCKINQKNNIHT